jgi:hypothetical protein
MNWQQLLTNIFERIEQMLTKSMEGLEESDLNEQPKPDCNSIGWLVWHLTRVQDRSISAIAKEEQLWLKDGWYTKFNRNADPDDFGLGHDVDDLKAFDSPDAEILLGYHNAVQERTKRYLANLPESELESPTGQPKFPIVGLRLAAMISDNLQHVGQVAYLRGLLKGKGWFDG